MAVVVRFETSQAEQATKKLTGHVNKLDNAAKAAQGSLDKQGKAASAAGAGTAKLGVAAKMAAPGVHALGTAVKAALGPVGLLLTAAGAMTQAFGVLAKQDFAEAKVRTLGVNSEELTKRLKGVSRELGGQASVVELTAAAYDVASAGFANAADNAKILKAASLGAAGGFSDINTVGDAATSVLNAYGKTADEVGAIVDGFIQTQNDGKIIIGQYAANIAKVSPVAAALGVELEEVNAAVAQITAGGTNAEMTFTGLKTALAQVAAGKVGQEFKKFGIEINSSTIRSEGLAGTLEKIKKSGADAGTVIKAFGTEAGPAILALLKDTEKFNRLLENQRTAQGAAAKAAFEANDTINGSLNRLRVAFENLFADGGELGDLLKLIFKGAAVTVEVLGVTINNLLSPFRAIGAAVNAVGQAIGEALGMKGVNVAFEMQEAYEGVLGTFSQISDFIVGLGVRFGEFFGRIITGTSDVKKFVQDNLIGAFTGAFEGIKQKMFEFYNGLPDWAKGIIQGAANAAKLAGSVVSGTVGRVQQFVSTTIGAGQGFKADEKARVANAQQQQAAAAANGIVATGGLSKDAQKEEQRRQQEAQRLADAAFKSQEKQQEAFENQVQKLHEKQAIARAILDGNEEEVRNAFLLSRLHKQHGEEKGDILYQNHLNEQSLQKQVKESKKLQDQQEKAAERMKQLYTDIGMTIKDGVVSAIKGAIDGTKSLRDVAVNLLNNIANKLLDVAVNMALFGVQSGTGSGGGLLGGLFNFGGKRAAGGPVSAGSSYLVGERGPELFTPSRSGNIIPNNAMGSVGNITVNVDASGTNVQGDTTDQRALGEAIGSAVRQEILKQKRPGGLLA